MFKLPNYYYKTNNATLGILIGVVVILFIYCCLFTINSFILYNYLNFIHMEGRIIDIYSRVTADAKQFFVPMDNEVSARYLRWLVSKMRTENKNIRAQVFSKQASITYHTVADHQRGYQRNVTYIAIYRSRKLPSSSPGNDDKLVLYRHFIKTEEGAICELEEDLPFTVDDYPFLEVWPQRLHRSRRPSGALPIEPPADSPRARESNLLAPPSNSKAGVRTQSHGKEEVLVEPDESVPFYELQATVSPIKRRNDNPDSQLDLHKKPSTDFE
jgi:hypothetical protein